jgi:glutamate-1-semialdehyde 2,1-aminomutase
MMAIRVARAFTGRPLMAKFEGGYHGQHDYAMVSLAPDLAAAGPASHPKAVAPAGIPDGARDSMIILPFNDPGACEAILTEHAADLAGVIVEPVMGVAGTVLPADGFLQHLRDVTRRLGALLIFDEVITFRLGYGGAQALFGVTPDLTVLGKIIGGGYPIGAVAGAAEVMELFNPARPGAVTLSGTFQANPVTLAAGIAAMKRLTPEALEQLNALSARLVARLRPLLGQARIPLQVNAIGSLLNLHATAEPVTDHRSSARGDREFLKWLHLALLNEGVLLSPRGMACLSLAMTEADLAHFLAAFQKALQTTGAWVRDAVDA